MKINVVAFSIRCGDGYRNACAVKQPQLLFDMQKYSLFRVLWLCLCLFSFCPIFSLACPFGLIYFLPVLFPFSLSVHLLHLPPRWIVVGYMSQRCFGQSTDNAMPTPYTIIIGLPGCQHRSSWEIYFACQNQTNKIILHNAATSYPGN